MTRTARRLGILPGSRAGLMALALVTTGCAERRQGNPPPVPVTVSVVEQRVVPYEITAPGTVEPIEAVAVTAQVNGLLTSVRFREGDEVAAGQVLFEIDPRPYQNVLQQAQATLARNLLQLENARRQVERYEALARSEYVTSEQFEALRTSAEALAATVKADSATVDNARLNLEYTTIRAPISGRTGSLLVKAGNVVRVPGTGPLVMLNQTRPILVRFAVAASHLPEIRQYRRNGLAVRAEPGSDHRAGLLGALSFVDNTVDTTTGTILLKGRFANGDGALWPGQFVTATLVLFEERDVTVVPVPAVMNGEAGTYVFVVAPDSTAAVRPVEVGRSVGDLVIVTRGLTPGETVVTDGQLRLVPGARVEIKPATDQRERGS